jgi:hypothetical protein
LSGLALGRRRMIFGGKWQLQWIRYSLGVMLTTRRNTGQIAAVDARLRDRADAAALTCSVAHTRARGVGGHQRSC